MRRLVRYLARLGIVATLVGGLASASFAQNGQGRGGAELEKCGAVETIQKFGQTAIEEIRLLGAGSSRAGPLISVVGNRLFPGGTRTSASDGPSGLVTVFRGERILWARRLQEGRLGMSFPVSSPRDGLVAAGHLRNDGDEVPFAVRYDSNGVVRDRMHRGETTSLGPSGVALPTGSGPVARAADRGETVHLARDGAGGVFAATDELLVRRGTGGTSRWRESTDGPEPTLDLVTTDGGLAVVRKLPNEPNADLVWAAYDRNGEREGRAAWLLPQGPQGGELELVDATLLPGGDALAVVARGKESGAAVYLVYGGDGTRRSACRFEPPMALEANHTALVAADDGSRYLAASTSDVSASSALLRIWPDGEPSQRASDRAGSVEHEIPEVRRDFGTAPLPRLAETFRSPLAVWNVLPIGQKTALVVAFLVALVLLRRRMEFPLIGDQVRTGAAWALLPLAVGLVAGILSGSRAVDPGQFELATLILRYFASPEAVGAFLTGLLLCGVLLWLGFGGERREGATPVSTAWYLPLYLILPGLLLGVGLSIELLTTWSFGTAGLLYGYAALLGGWGLIVESSLQRDRTIARLRRVGAVGAALVGTVGFGVGVLRAYRDVSGVAALEAAGRLPSWFEVWQPPFSSVDAGTFWGLNGLTLGLVAWISVSALQKLRRAGEEDGSPLPEGLPGGRRAARALMLGGLALASGVAVVLYSFGDAGSDLEGRALVSRLGELEESMVDGRGTTLLRGGDDSRAGTRPDRAGVAVSVAPDGIRIWNHPGGFRPNRSPAIPFDFGRSWPREGLPATDRQRLRSLVYGLRERYDASLERIFGGESSATGPPEQGPTLVVVDGAIPWALATSLLRALEFGPVDLRVSEPERTSRSDKHREQSSGGDPESAESEETKDGRRPLRVRSGTLGSELRLQAGETRMIDVEFDGVRVWLDGMRYSLPGSSASETFGDDLVGTVRMTAAGETEEADRLLARTIDGFPFDIVGRLQHTPDRSILLQPGPSHPVAVVARLIRRLRRTGARDGGPVVVSIGRAGLSSTAVRVPGTEAAASDESASSGSEYSRVAVDGAIAARHVHEFFRQHIGTIESCYNETLTLANQFDGSYTITLVVDGSGRIRPESVELSRYAPGDFEECLSRRLGGTELPVPVDGQPVDIEYPVELTHEIHEVEDSAGSIHGYRPSRPRPEPEYGRIEVLPQRPEVDGALDREIVRRVARQHRREVKYCYEQELERNPNLEGEITVEFTISQTGEVVAALIAESTLGNASVETCLQQKIRRWRFPEPKGNGIVEVDYPFTFSTE